MERTVRTRLEMAIGGYLSNLNRATAATRASAQTMRANMTGATKSVGGGFKGLATTMGGVQAGLIGAGGLAFAIKTVVGQAVQWESAFAGVKKTVSGTPEQLDRIGNGLRRMSTELPTSAVELAEVAASAGQLGIETDNVLGFTETIAHLGETTNLAGEQGATQLARFANITQMAQSDFNRLGSTIVELGNNFATTEADISSMALRIAGAGAQVGMTEADILAISTALSSVGIEAEAGGSAISKLMIDIASEVATGGDKLAQFAQVANMTVDEFRTAWEQDAAGALNAFITGLGNMEAQGGDTLLVLEELGIKEVRMRDALLRASGAGDLLTDALESANSAWETNLALALEASTRYETTAAKWDMLKGRFTDVGTSIGTGLIPALDRAITKADRLARLLGGTSFDEDTGKGMPGWQGVTPEQAFTADELSDWGYVDRTPLSAGKQLRVDATASARLSGVAAQYEAIRDSQIDRGLEATTDRFTGMAEAMGEVISTGSLYVDATHDWEAANDIAKTTIEEATAALEAYKTEQAEAVDPVLRLEGAIRDVESAQTDYTEAVDKYGRHSPEAEDAAFRMAGAVSAAEQAALDGRLSFDQFEAKLDSWVDQGLITEGAAHTLKERVKTLREESEDYQGEYSARFEAQTQTAMANVETLRRYIDRLPRTINIAAQLSYDTAEANRFAALRDTDNHDGGLVPTGGRAAAGLGTNEVMVRAEVGEFMVRKEQAGRYAGVLKAINAGTYHNGGGIGPAGRVAGPSLGAGMAAGGGSTVTNDNRQFTVVGKTTPEQRFDVRDLQDA